MANYQHILVAVDTTQQYQHICRKALDLANHHQAKLSLCHLVENYLASDFAYEAISNVTIEMQEELLDHAKQRIHTIGNELNIPTEHQWVEFGNPRQDVVRLADEHQVDLIVIGSHGRHGIQLLLGSTANAVLHHANCDVLAVRLSD